MAFRFNFTRRKKIRLADVEIRVKDGASPLTVFLVAALGGYRDFDPGDRAVLEALRLTKAQRIDLGLVSSLAAKREIVFDEFADAEDVHWRLKVVDAATRRIKGLAEEIRRADKPDKPTPLQSIFPVQWADPEDGLGDQFWGVSFKSNKAPVLLLAKGKLRGKDCVRSPEFKALVWPQALRNVLFHAFVVRADNLPDWVDAWRTFAETTLGAGAPPDLSDRVDDPQAMQEAVDWIDSAVAAFSRHFGLRTVELKGLSKGDLT